MAFERSAISPTVLADYLIHLYVSGRIYILVWTLKGHHQFYLQTVSLILGE